MTDRDSTAPVRSQTEERVNAITHALGFVLSLLAMLAIGSLSAKLSRGDAIAGLVFGSTLVTLYAVSTLSHAVPRSALQDLIRSWDQGTVYLVIAATYTPFIWTGADPVRRNVVLAAVWLAAAAGFASKVFGKHRVNALSTLSYLLLGWVPAIFLKGAVTWETFAWIAAGGVSYTVGVAFLKWDYRAKFFHATWHLCVIVGSACHFYAIYQLVLVPRAMP